MNNYFRFDTELHSLQEELKKEKAQREKITREKDMAISDKFSMEQTLSVSFHLNTHKYQINKKKNVFSISECQVGVRA